MLPAYKMAGDISVRMGRSWCTVGGVSGEVEDSTDNCVLVLVNVKRIPLSSQSLNLYRDCDVRAERFLDAYTLGGPLCSN